MKDWKHSQPIRPSIKFEMHRDLAAYYVGRVGSGQRCCWPPNADPLGSTMSADRDPSAAEQDLAFRYYEDQWAQLRHHAQQRATVTLQLLVVSVTLGGAYFAASTLAPDAIKAIRLWSSGAIVALAIVGILFIRASDRTMELHKLRARSARDLIPILKPVAASGTHRWPRINRYFSAVFWATAIYGAALFAIELRH